MLYTINQLYEHLYQKANDVYKVFKNFFGEDYVDFQPCLKENLFKLRTIHELQYLGIEITDTVDYDQSIELSDTVVKGLEDIYASHKVYIYVWWPNVTVTNEHNRSIHIKDLYARVTVQLDGRIPYENRGFGLNRATYTKEQFLSNYMHSHIEGIPKGNFTSFMLPCLGRGPINNTIETLKSSYDDVTWMLFCQELAMYVTVESVAGGPWHSLETVGSNVILHSHNRYSCYIRKNAFVSVFSDANLKDFIKYYLEEGHLSLTFKEGHFCCGMPYYEYIIDISNAFIDFFNKHLKKDKSLINMCYRNKLLFKAIAAHGKFYKYGEDDYFTNVNLDPYRNKKVLTFKGQDILTTITDEETTVTETTPTIVINNDVATYMLHHILRTINYRYKNEYYHNKYGHLKNASSYKRILYI